jgi:hypothetical protein
MKEFNMKNLILFNIFIIMSFSTLYSKNIDNKNTIVCGIKKIKNKSSNYVIYDNNIQGIDFDSIEDMKKNNFILLHIGKCKNTLEK